jgi:hypothetical protein
MPQAPEVASAPIASTGNDRKNCVRCAEASRNYVDAVATALQSTKTPTAAHGAAVDARSSGGRAAWQISYPFHTSS